MLKTSLISLSTALLLSIAGCSGGGSSSSSNVTDTISEAYSGVAIDGLLIGSIVCIDANRNNVCDAGEPTAITGNQGQFTMEETTVTGPLLVIGGTDKSTGNNFTGLLKAPNGSSVISPLTSAIQSLVERGNTPKNAAANVKAAMNLPDVDLTTFNPLGEASVNARAILAKQTQLQVLVHSAAVTVAGTDAGTDVSDVMDNVFTAIVGNFNGATTVVVLDADRVTAATKTAADEVYADNPTARVATKVIAQTSAESSVLKANTAQETISSGTPEEAAGNLDSAITQVNTTSEAELQSAAEAAKIQADALNLVDANKIAEIEALQKAQQEAEALAIAAIAAQAKAEADLLAAKIAAEAEATDRAKYEAYLLAEAEAAKAAAEKAAADEVAALAEAAAAAEEKAIAAEAAQRESEAEAAAAQALAEKLAAEAEQAAAEEAARLAALADDLAAAIAAAAQAATEAAQGIAQAQVNANIQIANAYAIKAKADANATQILANLDSTGTLVNANATTAATAADAAVQAALDANITATAPDYNISVSTTAKNEAASQAALAAAALLDAQKIKGEQEIIAAQLLVIEAQRTRIGVIVTDINQTKTDFQILYDVNGSAIKSQIESDMSTIEFIGFHYQDALDEFNEANASSQLALQAYSDANTSLIVINGAYANVLQALSDVNEIAADVAKTLTDLEKSKLEAYFATATEEAAKIATLRVAVEAVKLEVDEITAGEAGVITLPTPPSVQTTSGLPTPPSLQTL